MATAYSKIQRNFWETDEAREMTPEEKYFGSSKITIGIAIM